MGSQILSHYHEILDIKITFSSVSNLKKILNLTSDPHYYSYINMFVCNIFLRFIIKRLINGIHKTFLKHSIINGFRTHHFLTFAKRFLYQTFAKPKNVYWDISFEAISSINSTFILFQSDESCHEKSGKMSKKLSLL